MTIKEPSSSARFMGTFPSDTSIAEFLIFSAFLVFLVFLVLLMLLVISMVLVFLVFRVIFVFEVEYSGMGNHSNEPSVHPNKAMDIPKREKCSIMRKENEGSDEEI